MKHFAVILLFIGCFIAASAATSADTLPAPQLASVQLYQPDDDLKNRLGTDVSQLAGYIQALQAKLTAAWQKDGQPGTKGLLVAVGVKPNGQSRVWVDAVEGTLPAGVIQGLEHELATVPPVSVQNGPIAFALHIRLSTQDVQHFPDMPAAWSAASVNAHKTLEVPDQLFDLIWKN